MTSKRLRTIDDAQSGLPFFRHEGKEKIHMSLINQQKTLCGAVALCVQLSGLEEKELYMSLGIDAGHWTRIMRGDAHFPLHKLCNLMDLCGNEVPLFWLANARGYGLVVLQTESERRLEEMGKELEEERKMNKWLTSLLRRD